MKNFLVFMFFCGNVPEMNPVEVDYIDCGVDYEAEVMEGFVPNEKYPWLGILFYTFYGELGVTRAVTSVALIQREFVVAVSADIGPMPKADFRRNARVLLGEGWEGRGRRVRNYVIHPQYEETMNTVALIQLRDPIRARVANNPIKVLCPPPERLRNPKFYIVKFEENYEQLQKKVIPVEHVPASLCRQFYISANLYEKKMRPPHVTCALSLENPMPCVWDAGAALVARDVWGRWQLLGLGVRGPGCGAPSRYLDMMNYYPWIENSLSKFQRLTISKISNQKYVLRSGTTGPDNVGAIVQRFGNCDEEEKTSLLYRDIFVLRTDNTQYQFATYNMSIFDAVEYSCLTLELVNATASSEMRVKHVCPRQSYGTTCHAYKGSVFQISVYLMFSDGCLFEMYAWGFHKNMTLLDVQEWKWEEGTYYEDFTMQPVEYRGPTHMTTFGFEPADTTLWVPDYDVWTTTEFDNTTFETSSLDDDVEDVSKMHKGYDYKPTASTTMKPSKTFNISAKYKSNFTWAERDERFRKIEEQKAREEKLKKLLEKKRKPKKP